MVKHAAVDLVRDSFQLDAEKQELFEQIVARYEHDWHQDRSVNWQDYLPDDEQLRLCLAAELPLIEAEFMAAAKPELVSLTVLSSPNDRTQAADAPAQAQQPQHTFRATNNYHSIIRQIRGGLGDVFVIGDEVLGRVVVVKQLQSRWLGNAKALRAFEREVRITSLLEHPSIVPVHSYGISSDGRPFYCMRYIEGQTLQEAIDQMHASDRFDMNSARGLLTHFVQICRTIAYAGSRGIIHRDIKPSNIIIGNFGQTLMLDWGLAKELQTLRPGLESSSFGPASSSLSDPDEDHESLLDTDRDFMETQRVHTAIGDVVGTPAYMSPEQAAGKTNEYSIRTDVFGLGTVLYSILFAKPPYSGKNAAATVRLAESASIEFSTEKSTDSVYRGLVAICRKALSPDAQNRYPDAQSLADDAERWLAGESVSVCRQPLSHRIVRFASRQRTLASVAGLLLVATLAAVLVGSLAVQAERNQKIIAANTANANAKVAENVAEYIAKVYRSADPFRFDDPGFVNKGEADAKATLRQILDAGYELLRTDLRQHQIPYGDLLISLGTSYRGLGDYQRAEELLTEAKQVRLGLMGADDLQTLECEYQLCRLAYESGDYVVAENSLRVLIETIDRHIERIDKSTPNDNDRSDFELLQASAKFNLAWLLYYQPLGLALPQFKPGSVAESQSLFREVIALRRKYMSKNHRSIGLAYAALASAQFCETKSEKEALLNAATAMEIFNSNEQESALGNFLIEYQRAENLRKAMKYDEAEKQYLKLDKFIVDQVGEKHPLLTMHRWNMVGFYRKFGVSEKAEDLISKIRLMARELARIRSAPAHLDGLRQYAEALEVNQRLDDAVDVYQEILSAAQERPGQFGELITTVQAKLISLSRSEN